MRKTSIRKIIINTNYGSDDAIALMIALKSKGILVETITAVGGNVPLGSAVKNVLMTVEVTGGQKPPLFVGTIKPLFRELVTTVNVHGKDGVGDIGLICPVLLPESEHAVDTIIRIVKSCPGEIEFVTIGSATNVALAVMEDPNTMKRAKQIYTMRTFGSDPGNYTSVSEFNVYVDVETFHITITVGVPVTIIGFDLRLGKSALTKIELDTLVSSEKKEAMSAVTCNRMVVDYNITTNGRYFLDFPDMVIADVILRDDIILERRPCYVYVCLKEEAAYGQVILSDGSKLVTPEGFGRHNPNVKVYTKIDTDLFKKRLLSLFTQYLAWTQGVQYSVKETL